MDKNQKDRKENKKEHTPPTNGNGKEMPKDPKKTDPKADHKKNGMPAEEGKKTTPSPVK